MSARWEAIDGVEGAWTIEVLAKGWSLRTYAVAGEGGALLVISPVRSLGDDVWTALAKLGEPRAVLAPNHFHHLGVKRFLERFPAALPVCSDVARPRLEKQTGLRFSPLSAAPAGIELLVPDGLKNGEVWVRRGPAWIVSDAFFNADAPPGAMGFVLRRLATVPGLCLGRTFRWLAVGDRRAYRAWLDARLAADAPTVLAVGHGAVARGADLPQRLGALARARL